MLIPLSTLSRNKGIFLAQWVLMQIGPCFKNSAHCHHLRIGNFPGIHYILSIKKKKQQQQSFALSKCNEPSGLDPGTAKGGCGKAKQIQIKSVVELIILYQSLLRCSF